MSERFNDPISGFLNPPHQEQSTSANLVERQVLRILGDGHIHYVGDLEKNLRLNLLEISPVLERMSRARLLKVSNENQITLTETGKEILQSE